MADVNAEDARKMMSPSSRSTIGIWAGEAGSHFCESAHHPIAHNIAFVYSTLDEWTDVAMGRRSGHIYSRNTNPTVALFEEKVRQLELAEAATSFASGMAAISNTLLALLRPGDRVVSITDTYGGTNQLFTDFLPKMGIRVTLCRTDDQTEIESAVSDGCRLLYLETPTNPTLKVVDIQRLADAAHSVDGLVVVDNTVATPINQNPLQVGADLVVHSASKFLGGHGDALGGIVCGCRDLVDRVFHYREINGAALGAFAAYLLTRGLKTLDLRVERHNQNALAIARFLEGHPAVDKVFYPGLDSHPKHDVAKKQMRGFGGMLSFTLRPEMAPSVGRFLENLRLAHLAASLGHVETLVGVPATTSHVECSAEERSALGIPENLVRYSSGIESARDLIADIDAALTLTSKHRSFAMAGRRSAHSAS